MSLLYLLAISYYKKENKKAGNKIRRNKKKVQKESKQSFFKEVNLLYVFILLRNNACFYTLESNGGFFVTEELQVTRMSCRSMNCVYHCD